MSPKNTLKALKQYVSQQVLGQPILVDRLLIALLADGHLLVEGAPGLAKTRAVKVLSDGIEGNFHRIQFTPDLLPADLTGTDVYRPEDGSFVFQPGPLFHNLVLADEVNRAPAKVQSALLEAMAERQITVGKQTHQLPSLFLVMATQNPIEQEGTYPLPEAQLDRFLLYVRIGYPDSGTEKDILRLARSEASEQNTTLSTQYQTQIQAPNQVSEKAIFDARQEVLGIHMSEPLEEYVVQLVLATRNPDHYSDKFGQWVQYGASPRATIALDRCARAHAWLNDRDFVIPEDIQALAYDVLRHRVLLTYEAEAEGVTTDDFIHELINEVPAP